MFNTSKSPTGCRHFIAGIVYGDYIKRVSVDGWNGGVKVFGRRKTTRFLADGIAFCSQSEGEMKEPIEKFYVRGWGKRERSLTVNRDKM